MAKSVSVALTAMIAGLYFVLVHMLGPISFIAPQVRVADALLMLPTVLGLPAVVGVTLGCFAANMFPVGHTVNIIDVIFGSTANLVAGYVVYKIAYNRATAKRLMLSAYLAVTIVTVIVGSYLPFIIPEVAEVNLLTVLTVGWLGVLPGETIAIGVIGLPLVKALKKTLGK